MKFGYATLLVVSVAVLVAACATPPEPHYVGPGGQGRVVYQPNVGLTREGANTNTDEQARFLVVQQAFDDKHWATAIQQSIGLTEDFPEGSRAVEAILLRIRARLELGRSRDPDSAVPASISLEDWLFLYLAPIYDTRLQQLLQRGEEFRTVINELRDKSVGTFVNDLAKDANALYNSGQLDAAIGDARTLVTYYLPALELREFRNQTAELTRDIAWLSYAAEAFNRTIALADDLLVMNPSPSVKADALFIEGQAQRRNGAHALAANTFGLLYNGAGLRDTDTRWRPYALMWQIKETMETSKGPTYDLVPYEAAMELLGEYELYTLENPNISDSVHEQFVQLMTSVYDILILRDRDAADQYSRLGEDGAEQYYLAEAAKKESERDNRVAELSKAH